MARLSPRSMLIAWLGLGLAGCAPKAMLDLLLQGDEVEVRARPAEAPLASTLPHPGLLVLALDGVDRELLYDLLRRGELPELSRLLFADGAAFPHAHFEERLLSTLPSTTMPAWVTALTGVAPAWHGVSGNEFFIRETGRLAAPIPVTFADPEPVVSCYTDGYLNGLVRVPGVYQRMRDRDPHVLIWVAMQHYHAGADRLLITDRTVAADAFRAFLEESLEEVADDETSHAVFATLDEQVIETVIEALPESPVAPDVLTVYLAGADLFAHVADQGPDPARRYYLRETLEPLFARLREALVARHALEDRYVLITSDHGHTEVVHDDAHALGMDLETDPPAVLVQAGFRVRPFRLEVDDDESDFQSVFAYQGALAYVYLADRSQCPREGDRCDWTRPPRFQEDVLAVAEAFHRNDRTGELVPELRGVLDMVLVRRPKPWAQDDDPFEVYVGDGRLVPLEQFLERHPHPRYVSMVQRLRDLAVGPAGERAGDVILVAHNGDRDRPEERYYFAARYRSWHGSPSLKDGAIPLVVAHPRRSASEIRGIVRGVLGNRPYQQRVADLLLALRYGASDQSLETRARTDARSAAAPLPMCQAPRR